MICSNIIMEINRGRGDKDENSKARYIARIKALACTSQENYSILKPYDCQMRYTYDR
jgi:hypothetical protein